MGVASTSLSVVLITRFQWK